MTARSLRLRLLAGGTLAIAVALAVAWVAMTLIFDRHVERGIEADLQRQAVPLIAGLRVAGGRPVVDREPADPRFATPASGLYWSATAPRGAVQSRSLWDASLPAAQSQPGGWRSRQLAGPFGQRLLVVERTVQPDADSPLVALQLGYDLAQLVEQRRAFGTETAAFLVLLWAVLSVAAWAQVRLGLQPLADIEAEVAGLRHDPAARLAGRYPTEVLPLTRAIDALADARQRDVERARRRAADLAHGLKTPLAALAAQTRRAREAGATAAAAGLDAAIRAVRSAVEGELARTRVGLARGDGGATNALKLVERLVAVLEHTEAAESVAFAVDVADGLTLPLGEDDATDLLGPLIENAASHARRLVRATGNGDAAAVWVAIADDGAGIDADRHDDAVLRGERLDAAGPGHGLGLAIARDLAEATGATLTLGPADLGGLQVTVRWLR